MRRWSLPKAVCALVGIGILALTLLFLFGPRRDVPLSKKPKSPLPFASGKGISFVEYKGDQKLFALSIGSFSIERARIGPFAIGPLNVAHVEKLSLNLYIDAIETDRGSNDSERKASGTFDIEAPFSTIKRTLSSQARKVKVIVVKDISLNLWRKDQRVFRISSDTATVDQKTRQIVFTGHARMDAGEKRTLLSHRIRLDPKTLLFRANDPYILTLENQKKEGSGIETDYQFQHVNFSVTESH